MIENLKARWAIIFLSFIIAGIWILPNFVNVGEGWLFSKAKINYGLDIQGGLHLVLGVDVEGVIAEKTARLVRSLPKELKDEGVAFGQVEVSKEDHKSVVIHSGDIESVKNFLNKIYPTTLQVVSASEDQVQLRYFDAKVIEYKQQVINQAIEVIRNRIDEFGVSEPSIAAQGDNRIIVQLPGIKDSAQAKELINRTARLSFRPVSEELDENKLISMVSEVEKAGNYELGKDDLRYSSYVKKINEDLKAQLPKDTRIVFEKSDSAVNMEAGKTPYLIKTNNNLTGDLLEDASVRPDEFGKPEVVFKFGVEGRRQFAQMTEENIRKRVAIILDDVVQSAPVIQDKINSATARITLNQRNYQQAMDEASFIATALRAGALPAALEQLEERTVGPTLGQDSIDRGKVAGVIGSVLVLLFMLIYYRALGVIANLALAFNIMLIIAILTSLGATLTLPGVAGIVLTVGMAVDANVIIFERIKEELRKGASLKLAVKDGFGHAFSAIFDANITTAAVCFVLMYFGSGPVRGFAVTLICGVVTSMFTAIFVSRAIMDLLINKYNVKNLVKA